MTSWRSRITGLLFKLQTCSTLILFRQSFNTGIYSLGTSWARLTFSKTSCNVFSAFSKKADVSTKMSITTQQQNKTDNFDPIKNSTTQKTDSSAVAKGPHDASCLSVVSFNSKKRQTQSFIFSYYRFITVYD